MFFSDDDVYDGLKLSLDTLTEIIKTDTDANNRRKAAVDLASILLQSLKMKSDKEDWKSLMTDNKSEDEGNTEG